MGKTDVGNWENIAIIFEFRKLSFAVLGSSYSDGYAGYVGQVFL